VAMGLGAAVAIAAGFGVGLVLRQDGEAAPAGDEFLLYLTDAPRRVDRLDVELSSVRLGDRPLEIVRTSFDLASLRGPGDALLVARGPAPPPGQSAVVVVEFKSARATVAGLTHELPAPPPLALDMASLQAEAALVDIDLEKSVVDTPQGMVFQPQASFVYAVADLPQAAEPDFTAVAPIAAAGLVPDAARVDLPDLAVPDGGALAADGDALAAGLAPGAAATDGSASTGGLAVAADTPAGDAWLVHFADGAQPARIRLAVEGAGAVLLHSFDSFPVAYVRAGPSQLEALRTQPDVAFIEADLPLTFFDAASKQAIRQPQAVDPVTGLRDHFGNPVDGRGIGVAVVDTGIDTLHPDLGMAPAGPVAANYQLLLDRAVPDPYTDVSGHGTHVAAIVAGSGAADPSVRGVAPGAKLYGLGAAAGPTIAWAAQAFEWVLQHQNDQDPRIRVVTNSWGSGTQYEPRSLITRYVNAMVDRDIVVVFAAGNTGGDGAAAQTSSECQIPRAGVICVAAFDDLGTGTRDGRIWADSSRGQASDQSTWPDVSAPGVSILSARPPAGRTTGMGFNLNYVELSGTSQAAPHVAAVAALMLQKQPNMNPAAVEANIKATAYKFTDGGAYVNGSHFAKGAGLLDAFAAVQNVG
jgi:serine protease AprX